MAVSTGTAILGSGALAAGASYFGGKSSASAAKRGARAQAGAANKATEAELDMYYQGREDLAPWRHRGANALRAYIGSTIPLHITLIIRTFAG